MSPSSGDHNGSLMTAVNETIDRLHASLNLPDSDFHCECGHIGCKKRITLSRGEYAGLAEEGHPLIFPAHADRESAAETELHELRTQVHQLKRTLVTRANVEQAKGVLVGWHGITPEQAFEALRRGARYQRRSLEEVCAQVMAEAVGPYSQGSEPAPSAPRRRNRESHGR